MMYHLKGKITNKEIKYLVIDAAGVGYQVFVPTNILDRVPAIDSEIKLYIYQAVKEDSLTLYGFLNKEERSLFALLITVSGVGPKAALTLMSNFAIETITSAIVKCNDGVLSSAPGVGKKTAQKICIELKEKVAKKMGIKPSQINQAMPQENGVVNDAIGALITLGYNPKEAQEAILNSGIDFEKAKDVESIIKASLKSLI